MKNYNVSFRVTLNVVVEGIEAMTEQDAKDAAVRAFNRGDYDAGDCDYLYESFEVEEGS